MAKTEKEWAAIWNKTKGDEYDKALGLLKDYCQLSNHSICSCWSRFFCGRWGNHHAAVLVAPIKACVNVFKVSKLRRLKVGVEDLSVNLRLTALLTVVIDTVAGTKKPINKEGDLARTLRVIQDRTNRKCYNELMGKTISLSEAFKQANPV